MSPVRLILNVRFVASLVTWTLEISTSALPLPAWSPTVSLKIAADAGPPDKQTPSRTRDEDRTRCIYPPGRDSRKTLKRNPSPRARLASGGSRLLWRLANCSFEFATATRQDRREEQQGYLGRFGNRREEVRCVIGTELPEVLLDSLQRRDRHPAIASIGPVEKRERAVQGPCLRIEGEIDEDVVIEVHGAVQVEVSVHPSG